MLVSLELKQDTNIGSLFIYASIVVVLDYLVFRAARPVIQMAQPQIWHTAAELLSIFISLTIFLVAWYTDHWKSGINRITGFFFLIAAIFYLANIFIKYILFPGADGSVCTWYCPLGRMMEGVALLSGIALVNVDNTANKWYGLFASLAFTAGVIYFIYPGSGSLPATFTANSGTTLNVIMEYVIIMLLLLVLFLIKKKLDENGMIIYRYVFIAVLLAISAELCFILFRTDISLADVMRQILKASCYYYLLKGIFVSIVTFTYDKMAGERKAIMEVFRDIPVGIIYYEKNKGLTYANKWALQILACKMEDIAGLTPGGTMKMFSVVKRGGEGCYRPLTEGGTPAKGDLMRIVNRKGITIKVKVTVHNLNNGCLIIFDDAKREQELENLQLQTEIILNSIKNSILVLDKANRIVLCNRAFCEIVEMEREKIMGMDLQALHQERSLHRKDISPPAMSKEGKSVIEESFSSPNGEKKEMLVQITPVYNSDGEVIGTVEVGTDVTCFKIEQQKLQQKERLIILGQMATGIVHEIKNPLTVIKGFSQVLNLIAKDDELKKYLKLIDIETERINKVINDFLIFAKPRLPVLKEVRLDELVESIKVIVDSNTFIKGINVEYNLKAGNYTVLADTEQIKQVLLNIVQNGIEAMAGVDDPCLRIKTGYNQATGEVYLTIANNGKPILPEEKVKIGTPFFTTKEKGTGLGLSISFQIIKEHNGRIDIDNENARETAFTVFLPSNVKVTERLQERLIV